MPRKKKAPVLEDQKQEEKIKVVKPKAKPRKKKANSTNVVSYIILALLIVFLVILAITYKDISNVKNEFKDVKLSVNDQSRGSVGYLQDEISRLKEQLEAKEKQIKEISGVYVNKEYQVQFDVPVDATRKSGVVDDDGLIMFGPTKDFDGIVLPEFTLRVYEKNDIDDYREKIKFVDESCSSSECIMLDFDYQSLDEDRELALNKVLQEMDFEDLDVWQITLDQDCIVPTILIYNEERDVLYEFQQQCAPTEKQGYEELEKIVKSLQFID